MAVDQSERNRKRLVGVLALAAGLALINWFMRGDHAALTDEPLEVITNSIGMQLTLIPAGDFLMGSPDSDKQSFRDEKPQHHVRISKPYYLGVYEVTQKEWQDVMGTTPWKKSVFSKGVSYTKKGDRFPAAFVDREDANEFCRKLTDRESAAGRLKDGESYRLPTEAEWEYACRARSITRYPFGDGTGPLGDYAWFRDNNWLSMELHAREVGRKRANDWGLFDMHGNVYEWCSDQFDADYYGRSRLDNPPGPSDGSIGVLRGGCWSKPAYHCRSAARFGLSQMIRKEYIGFRVALGFDPSE